MTPGYRDHTRPIAERVHDLISRMSLAEKLGQLRHQATALPEFGMPAYNFWSEGLHGVARNGRATVFPQVIGMAAAWNPELIERVAVAIGLEARAKYHAALRRHGETRVNQGLTLWSPNVNIYRDPRWGRGQETWGEDPLLTGTLGAAFVRGLQGDDERYLRVSACAKHFAVHSGPEARRHGFDAQVSPRDLHETYLPAFRALVDVGVETVMGAYNRVNGAACCAHPLLLGELLRDAWGFQGHVVSDCGAVSDIQSGHALATDPAEAAALALNAGCDLECGAAFRHLDTAIARGLTDEAVVDRALARVLTTRMRLGMFDPEEQVHYAATPADVVACAEHRSLAYKAAVESAVLLKNRNAILPLGPTLRSLRVVGPTAADLGVLLGSYHGLSASLTTLLEGIVGRLPEGVALEYRPGVQLIHNSTAAQDWLFDPAAQPDVVIACMGLSPLIEGEEGDAIGSSAEGDRTTIELPEVQAVFLRRLAAAGAKIVLVLTGGGPIALGELEALVEAVLFVWYPGEAGGAAVADLLFGHAAPSGKLPLSFPRSTADLPPFEDYSMRGRTYRYAAHEPLFPFGFGLGYTRFAYDNLRVERDPAGLRLRVRLRNLGERSGVEVAQVYLSALDVPDAPASSLLAFARVELAAGASHELEFHIPAARLALVGDDGVSRPIAGRVRLLVGGCSPGARGLALGAPEPVTGELALMEAPTSHD